MLVLCEGDGVQVTQYEVVQPTFAGDFRVLTARILIPDGTVLLPSDAGCAASYYRASCAALLQIYAELGQAGNSLCAWLHVFCSIRTF